MFLYFLLQHLLYISPEMGSKCVCMCSVMSDCDPVGCSPPGSSVHGISQAKILEQLAISFSGTVPTQKSNPRLLISRQILYHCAIWKAQAGRVRNTMFPRESSQYRSLMQWLVLDGDGILGSSLQPQRPSTASWKPPAEHPKGPDSTLPTRMAQMSEVRPASGSQLFKSVLLPSY